jgi:Ser/Thr protein kinase RdoA (MazF antagonist)
MAAAIHAASGDFVSGYARRSLDLEYLIDTPLAVLRPFLAHRPDDWSYLEGFAARVRARAETAVRAGLDWGVCHGDLAGDNMHLAEDHALTVFDFDLCGPGWRAYDLAAIQWHGGTENKSRIWEEFLKGYTEVRSLADADLAAVPLCHMISHLWVLGFRAGRAAEGRSTRLSERTINRELTFFRQWEVDHLESE